MSAQGILLTITEVIPNPGATVWSAQGLDEDGRLVTFAGDYRMMAGLYGAWMDAEEYGEEVEAEVQPWQILHQGAAPGARLKDEK